MSDFALAQYDRAEVHRRGVGTAHHSDDSAVWAEFYLKPIKHEYRSQQEGRPIYEEKEYIRITFPGDRTKTWDQPVRMVSDNDIPSDPERFPRQWRAFKAQQEQIPDGTPLEEFPAVSRARVWELKAMNIHTVEQYAGVPDGQIESLGLGSRVERDKCKAYLDRAVSMSQVSKLEAENETLKADVAMLQQQIKELGRMVQPSDDDQPKRGRPRSVGVE